MKHIVIVGATSTIAQHCARLWLQYAPHEVTLVGRNDERLQRVAEDLRVRSPRSNIHVKVADFIEPKAIAATVAALYAECPADIVLIAHGSLPQQQQCQDDLTVCAETLVVNAVSPALYLEAFARHMQDADHGILAVIGSIAGDRGRKTNYTYGAAKGLLERYMQGLQHRFAGTNVHMVLLKPGPTRTPMIAGLDANLPRLAEPNDVARRIVQAIAAKKPIVYVPAKWWLIMAIIRHLPAVLFNRLDF